MKPIFDHGLYQQPKDVNLNDWIRTLFEQYNICVYQSGYTNTDCRAKLEKQKKEILNYISSGIVYCPVEYRKKYKIYEFKNHDKEFVQLNLFAEI